MGNSKRKGAGPKTLVTSQATHQRSVDMLTAVGKRASVGEVLELGERIETDKATILETGEVSRGLMRDGELFSCLTLTRCC